MNKAVQGVIIAVILIAIAVGAWAVMTVPDAPEGAASAEANEDKPTGKKTMSYEGNTIREERGGKLVWELKAESMDINANSKDANMKMIQVVYHFPGGRKLTLSAGSGTYRGSNQEVLLKDQVRVESSDGMKLTCKELHMSGEGQAISAVGAATIQRDDMIGSGDKIDSTDGFHIFKIIGNAKLTKGAIQ